MSFFYRHRGWLGALLGITLGAQAQAVAPPFSQAADWREANEAVGQFERGHIDILQWEAANLPAPPPDTTADPPVWSLSQAIVSAQRIHPDLIARPGMNVLERTQLQLQQRSLALDIERAWWTAVAAQSLLSGQRQILLAAEVGHELAQRMARVGNWPDARQQRQHLSRLEAQAMLRVAEHEAQVAVLALWELTGAPMEPQALAARLPRELPHDLPPSDTGLPSPVDVQELERLALARHPEWPQLQQMAQRAMQGAGDLNGLLQAIQAATEPDATTGAPQALPVLTTPRWPHSWDKALEDQLKAEALERRIRRDVRMALSAWQTTQQLAAETSVEVEQLMTALEEDMLQRYNGMFKSTWDLLGATNARLEAVQATQNAQLNAQLAFADLRAVLDGLPYTGQSPGVRSAAPASEKGH